MLDLTKGRVVFDEESHTYRVGGREVLGVTRTLALAGYVDTTWFTECSKRGTVVHKAVELEAEGLYEPESWRDDLEEAGLPNDRIAGLLGHVEAWRRFREETGFQFLFEEDGGGAYSEIRLLSESRWIAGTADGIGTFRGSDGLVLADWKSGPPGPSTGPQTAAYASMFHELTGRRIARRLGVQLLANGHYRHAYFDDPSDFHDFEAALRVARWRLRHISKHTLQEAAA